MTLEHHSAYWIWALAKVAISRDQLRMAGGASMAHNVFYGDIEHGPNCLTGRNIRAILESPKVRVHLYDRPYRVEESEL